MSPCRRLMIIWSGKMSLCSRWRDTLGYLSNLWWISYLLIQRNRCTRIPWIVIIRWQVRMLYVGARIFRMECITNASFSKYLGMISWLMSIDICGWLRLTPIHVCKNPAISWRLSFPEWSMMLSSWLLIEFFREKGLKDKIAKSMQ